jgi:hypothetical protein
MVERVDMSEGATGSDESDWWRLVPAEVLELEFPVTAVGRRGLQVEPVEQFRRWAVQSLDRAGAESAALRAEIERLHLYIRSQWSGADPDRAAPVPGQPAAAQSDGSLVAAPDPIASGQVPAQGGGTPIGQALEVLARAQRIADERIAAAERRAEQAEHRAAAAQAMVENGEKRAALAREQARHSVLEADEVIEQRWARAETQISDRLADAEQEALGVVARACREYEEILTRAHRRAEQAAERALGDVRDEASQESPGRPVPADLEMKAAYLQTFARVSGAALRATLDVTRQEFARLRSGRAAELEPTLPAYRIFGTGEIEVLTVTPPSGIAISQRGADHAGHAEQVRSGALLSGVIRPTAHAS